VAKLNVMCARSMHKAVEILASEFRKQSGHDVSLDFGTVGALERKIAAGETADVMILSQSAMGKLKEAGVIDGGTQADVARTSIGVAVRAGVPVPDIGTAEAFRRLLLNATAIAFSDPAVGGSAGVYLAGLFDRMGLGETIKRKGMPQSSGAEVARRVAEGRAEVGLTLIGEIVPIAGVRIAGPLPAPIDNDTTYSAAVAAASEERSMALDFIAALTTPATRKVWQAAGFDLPSA